MRSSSLLEGLATCPRVRYLLSGTFNTLSLHLLAFDTLTNELSLKTTIEAQGPHQYLTLGRIRNDREREVYATTWAQDRRVSSWKVSLDAESITYINSQAVTATPSYVSVQPPPYFSLTSPSYGVETSEARSYLYQAGGPTGEVFSLDNSIGSIGDKVQGLIFLKGGENQLANSDKTRKALRYGGHSVDFDVNGLGYVADLGRNSILVYSRDAEDGTLKGPIAEVPSPTEHDGPRHVVPSPNGRYIFAVTEHNSFLDVYRRLDLSATSPSSSSPSPSFKHIQRVSIIPSDHSPKDYRGDTVRLSPSGQHIFATTRGMTDKVKGWVKGWSVSPMVLETSGTGQEDEEQILFDDTPGSQYQTPTSGLKANAFEWAPRYPLDDPLHQKFIAKDWAVLTDDEQGYIVVLEWDGKDLREVAKTQLPGTIDVDGNKGVKEGASHAIWLS
ncbi:unnamed protein product [Sympodiomycopsis kandeliae]